MTFWASDFFFIIIFLVRLDKLELIRQSMRKREKQPNTKLLRPFSIPVFTVVAAVTVEK